MPNDLPFQYSKRWRNISTGLSPQALAALEQHDRELEDYLNTLTTGGGTAGAAAAARFQNNSSDNTFAGTPQPVYWSFVTVSDSEGYAAFVDVETGETNDRIHIYTDGFYTATMTVITPSDSPGPFWTNVHTHTALYGGDHPSSYGYGFSGPIDAGYSATAFTSWAMQAGDYFHAEVSGVVSETFSAIITVEYVAPFGSAPAAA